VYIIILYLPVMGVGPSCCECCCLETLVWKRPPDHVYEIHAKPYDLITLHDGLDSLFVGGPHEFVFEHKVLLVVGTEHTCYFAWVPETPQGFQDHDRKVTRVAAVLKDDLDHADVVVVYDTAVVVPRS
jgi:hypothetical protein